MRWYLLLIACGVFSMLNAQSLLPRTDMPAGTMRSNGITLTRSTLPSPWSYQHLGLFCKLDVQLERRMKFPVLFRLGDVQQVEAWEGKGPWRSSPLTPIQ